MATQQEVAARLDAFTTGLGDDVLTIAQKMRDLQDAFDSKSQQAISDAMDGLMPSIERAEQVGQQLHAMGSDPANPLAGTEADSGTEATPTDSAPTEADSGAGIAGPSEGGSDVPEGAVP